VNWRFSLQILSRRLGGSRVWMVGNGPTVVVVHGGPGFDHKYLTPSLLPLARHFRLVFYDQRSRGAITPAKLIEQLRRIVAAVSDGSPVVLAHSWGTYLAFACLTVANAPVVRGAMLISPVPLTLKGFNRAEARFEKSLPTPAPTEIKALFPYYLAKRNRRKASIPIPHVDALAYGKIITALQASSYDFRKACASLPKRTRLVFGREDRLSRASDFREIRRRVAITNIPGAAHFAFAEQPETFRRLFLKAFGTRGRALSSG
jgi:pimeloyl-ACP methyl ester carboxylesterase